MKRALLILLVGLVLGAALGAGVGWLFPLNDVRAGFADLHPDYKADYAVMVGAAYASNGDWDLAQQRLGALAMPDPAAYVVQVAEQYIEEDRSAEDIRNLARLAARFGYTTPEMQPYLGSTEPGS